MKKNSLRIAIVRGEAMRLVLLILLALVLVAAGAASGAAMVAKTEGATSVQLSAGAGFAGIRSRGNVLGRLRRGRIVATANVHLNGCASRSQLNNGLTECRGKGITFRTLGDTSWRVRLHGRGISAAGIARGCLILDARDTGSTGTFRIGEKEARPWPRRRTGYRLGAGTC